MKAILSGAGTESPSEPVPITPKHAAAVLGLRALTVRPLLPEQERRRMVRGVQITESPEAEWDDGECGWGHHG